MSLVGTRPPTVDEWEKYDLHHRVRLSVKPGITGMWQVSGRSEITDFEEVVKLDKEYMTSFATYPLEKSRCIRRFETISRRIWFLALTLCIPSRWKVSFRCFSPKEKRRS